MRVLFLEDAFAEEVAFLDVGLPGDNLFGSHSDSGVTAYFSDAGGNHCLCLYVVHIQCRSHICLFHNCVELDIYEFNLPFPSHTGEGSGERPLFYDHFLTVDDEDALLSLAHTLAGEVVDSAVLNSGAVDLVDTGLYAVNEHLDAST